MPGSVKKRIVRPRPITPPSKKRSLKPRAAAPQAPPQAPPPPRPVTQPAPPPATATGADILSGNNTADTHAQIANKYTLAWLILLSVMVVIGLVIVSWLLCRCRRRRRTNKDGTSNINRAGHTHHPSLEVSDGRNNHFAWNRHAPRAIEMVDRSWTNQSESVTPLAKAAVRPAGHTGDGVAVRVVEVAEDDGVSPLTTRFDRSPNERMGRYNPGATASGSWGEWWKRVSQIGRAY